MRTLYEMTAVSDLETRIPSEAKMFGNMRTLTGHVQCEGISCWFDVSLMISSG
jgi:hypothetical protein